MTSNGCQVGSDNLRKVDPIVDGLIWFSTDDVLKFLQKLKDEKVPCWQRSQAARTLEWYQALVLRVSTVDFTEFKLKLQEFAAKEKRGQVAVDSPILDDEGFAGEGKPGLINPNEPCPVQALRERMRVFHHPISIEDM